MVQACGHARSRDQLDFLLALSFLFRSDVPWESADAARHRPMQLQLHNEWTGLR